MSALKSARPIVLLLLTTSSAFAQDKPFELPPPGSAIRNYTCADPVRSCHIAPLDKVTLEKQRFLELADAREAVVLAEPQHWESVATTLTSLAKQATHPNSAYRKLYLDTAARIRREITDPQKLNNISQDAEMLSQRSRVVQVLTELENLVGKGGGSLADISNYQNLIIELNKLIHVQWRLYETYRKFHLNGGGVEVGPNPVRDIQLNINSFIVNECWYSRTDFYVVAVERPIYRNGLTLLRDSEVIRKILDGPNEVPQPLTYRCPNNDNESGPDKATYWLDPNRNLLVNDFYRGKDIYGKRLPKRQDYYSPSAKTEDLIELLRKIYGSETK